MEQAPQRDRLVELRRDFHRHPEPAWCEFYTTSRVVEELERLGVAGRSPAASRTEAADDELYLGEAVLDSDERMAVPDEAELAAWRDRAIAAGADPELIERMAGGHTGALAVLRRGDGPTVGLRVDIDGLPIEEADDPAHIPAAEGFRSEHEGMMHACGHDAHATFGIGVLEAVAGSDFAGTLKVFFQPAEEQVAGGKAMAAGGHLDDVDSLLAVHVGLDRPTGEVVAGYGDFLAVRQFRAEFEGESAHAAFAPSAGRNAVGAMATAVENLYAIPRHEDGPTRVNAGEVGGGTASNVVPASAYIEGEVRGGTTELKDYMAERAERVLESAAAMHDCDVTMTTEGEAPGAESDEELAEQVYEAAGSTAGVERRVRRAAFGASEDATYLMRHVQQGGGVAAYVGVGTDHPGGHHTATFDVDEDSLPVGVEVLARAILAVSAEGS